MSSKSSNFLKIADLSNELLKAWNAFNELIKAEIGFEGPFVISRGVLFAKDKKTAFRFIDRQICFVSLINIFQDTCFVVLGHNLTSDTCQKIREIMMPHFSKITKNKRLPKMVFDEIIKIIRQEVDVPKEQFNLFLSGVNRIRSKK